MDIQGGFKGRVEVFESVGVGSWGLVRLGLLGFGISGLGFGGF